MKSLNELVNDYPFSRITLERRMKSISNFRSRFCTRGKYNKLLINDEGIKLITHEKHNSTSKDFHTKRGSNSNQITKNDLVKTVHQLLELNDKLKLENKNLRQNKVSSKYRQSAKLLPDYKKQREADKQEIAVLKMRLGRVKDMSFMDKLKLLFKK